MDLIKKHETPIKTIDLTDMTVLSLNKTNIQNKESSQAVVN